MVTVDIYCVCGRGCWICNFQFAINIYVQEFQFQHIGNDVVKFHVDNCGISEHEHICYNLFDIQWFTDNCGICYRIVKF